ncbi:hypothetical protein E2I00_007638 [Balaenoptera physalus]|uniref:Uncharacterized protein n=1 Tax=Balaenoptera physalus TaxID=9770 RepID=A0A6A1QLG3_BALPH|nr:hypothetical protein E2I00_007638 [Balaenoptera physalus]
MWAVASDGSTPTPRAQMPVQPPSKDTEEMEAEGDSAAEMNGEEEESEEERSGSQTESEEESSGIYKGFCLDVIRNKYECELQGAKQHLEVNVPGAGRRVGMEVASPAGLAEPPRLFQSEKLLLYDTLQGELQERIQRLEEDRQSLDISSGPYIVYMLQEIDILEDWTAIKKVGPVLPVSGWGLAV